MKDETCRRVCQAIVSGEGYGPVIDLGIQKAIIPEMMVCFCDTAADISQVRREGRARALAILVGEEKILEKMLPPSIFALEATTTLDNFRHEVQSLSGLLDGRFLALATNNQGKILGIKRTFREILEPRYEEEARQINSLYSGMFHHLAVISRLSRALTFYVPPEGNLVIVYDLGRIVARYAMGDWHPTDYEGFCDVILAQSQEILIASHYEENTDQEVYQLCLAKLFRVAFLMSAKGTGAMLCIDTKLKVISRRKSGLAGIIGLMERDCLITDLEDEELANIASLDGAVLIDGKGRLREFNAILSPPKLFEGELHYGARHITALNYSAERDMAIVIAVSQDGSITAFFRGSKIAQVS